MEGKNNRLIPSGHFMNPPPPMAVHMVCAYLKEICLPSLSKVITKQGQSFNTDWSSTGF